MGPLLNATLDAIPPSCSHLGHFHACAGSPPPVNPRNASGVLTARAEPQLPRGVMPPVGRGSLPATPTGTPCYRFTPRTASCCPRSQPGMHVAPSTGRSASAATKACDRACVQQIFYLQRQCSPAALPAYSARTLHAALHAGHGLLACRAHAEKRAMTRESQVHCAGNITGL